MNLKDDNFGYLQVDIDGDGVDELLLGSNGSEENSDYAYIDSMFTIRNGKVCTVFESYSDREWYCLFKDDVFGAYYYPDSFSYIEYYKYAAGKKEFIEGIYYDPDYTNEEVRCSYSNGYRDGRELTKKEYYEMGNELEQKYEHKPKLQLHLFKEE